VSSYSCALTEGFADFFSPTIFPQEIPGFLTYFERFETVSWEHEFLPNVYVIIGSEIEGSVAAYFQDLLDDDSSPDGIAGDDDSVGGYPASYIADIVESCIVLSPLPDRPSGLDHLSYCFERRILPNIAIDPFAGRALPSGLLEAGTEPPEWSATDLRAVLVQNVIKEP